MATTVASVAYCGTPPDPAVLWTRWNLDPVLIGFLLLALGVYALSMARRPDQSSRGRRLSFYAGWAVMSAALVSPLCSLSVSLFAARVGQHMVLALIAAPLLAFGLPRARPLPIGSLGAAMAFAALLWFWHSPAPYSATFSSDAVYWAMHISTFGAAAWLWSTLLDDRPTQTIPAIAGRPLLHSTDGPSRCVDYFGAAAAVRAARPDDNRLGLIALAGPATWRRHHVDPRLHRVPGRCDVAARTPAGRRAAAAGAVVISLRRGLVASLLALADDAR